MDPALAELLLAEGTTADRMIEAIIRLRRPGLEIPGVRMVARFGTVSTCRLRAGDVAAVRAHPDEISLKLARPLGSDRPPPDPEVDGGEEADPVPPPRRPVTPLTGAGVVVGAMDWRFDLDHPSLKKADGSTRLLALWDQRATPSARSPKPYGYGRVYLPAEINRALAARDPYRRLEYHPAAGSTKDAHGTHVIDTAAGNGRGGGPVGVAPEADLVLVHLADQGTGGLANLGDSVRLLEAAHFIAGAAGPRPWVINSSVGRMGGPHDTSLLVQRALDEFLLAAPGRFLVQSAGNYRAAGTHASGVLTAGERRILHFDVDPQDSSTNELEIWYDGTDEFTVKIDPPGRTDGPTVPLGRTADIMRAGLLVGRVHHRALDPNNHDHHIDAFLHPQAAAGTWTVTIEARTVRSGRFHAWLERDEACPKCQARFAPDSRSLACTTGTIANGRVPLVVGAYDANDPTRPVARTSSSGLTRDGQVKPDLGAPGHRVRAARSAPLGSRISPGGTVLMSGTSMATPHVTGAVALCLQASGGRLTAQQIRTLVLGTADPPRTPDPERRLGHGYLDVAALLRVTQRAFAGRTSPRTTELSTQEHLMDPHLDPVSPLVLASGRACRDLLYRPDSELARWIRSRYRVVGRSGERNPADLRAGDIVLQVSLGHPTAGRCGVVADPELTQRPGDPVDPAGWYAQLADPAVPTGPAGRRILDATRCLPAGSVLLRAHDLDRDPGESEDDPDPGAWSGTPEQTAFRDRVLAAAIAAKQRPPLPNLRRDQLDAIAGTDILTRTTTARAVEALLAAATKALQTAQQAGEADALRTIRVTVTSGYRDDSRQRRLWLSYFRKYYNQSREARADLPGGPHADAALAYLLRPRNAGGFGIGGRIAAPGFSNHQGGIAVDLWQERTPGHRIVNETERVARARWRATWLHGWLVAHAAEHGFQPLATEEWHWEHHPGASRATGPRAVSTDPDLWTFRPTGYDHPVAVYYPPAARAADDVEVVFFAHGLVRGCPAPARLPSGFVSDPPFRLGRVVARSGRPVVLVVPLLDWANPGGGPAFGRERWHALARPDHLNRLMGQVMTELGRRRTAGAPTVQKLIIAGHSRAYDFLEPLAEQRRHPDMQRGALAKLAQIWAFDTTYAGEVGRWTDWLAVNPGLQVHVFFRPGSQTAAVGERFERHRSDRLHVTRAGEGHCAVPAVRMAELLAPAAAGAEEEGVADPAALRQFLELTAEAGDETGGAGTDCGCAHRDGA